MSAGKAKFDMTLKNLEKDLEETSEELSKVSIECDVWRSKFLASRFVEMNWFVETAKEVATI